jgi:hypothetical protein
MSDGLLTWIFASPRTAAADAAVISILRAVHGPRMRAAVATKKFWPLSPVGSAVSAEGGTYAFREKARGNGSGVRLLPLPPHSGRLELRALTRKTIVKFLETGSRARCGPNESVGVAIATRRKSRSGPSDEARCAIQLAAPPETRTPSEPHAESTIACHNPSPSSNTTEKPQDVALKSLGS